MENQNEVKVPKILDIRFASGNVWCACNLYLPEGIGPFPIIVMAHGLGGVKSMRLPAFAERFVKAGYACLLFDYRHFGESGGQPRQLLDIKLQLEDWQAAVTYARTRPEVNQAKIILWGTSFSGGHVLTLAADIPDLAAVISQCPFTDGMASCLAMDAPTSLRIGTLALLDCIRSRLGKSPLFVPVAAPVGKTALMNAPDAYVGYMGLKPAGVNIPNYVAARFALNIIRYYPGRHTPKITAPLLFCICENDSVAPTKATVRHANRAIHKEIRIYSYGHFEIYVGKAFEHVIRDQIDFLVRTVPC